MSSASPHKVLIPEPEAGGALQLTIQPAQVYVLGFAPETSTIEQDGQDVRVLCENGGRIVLYGFFPAISQADITLELKDGTLISGQDLADVLAMSLMDFRTNGQPDLNVAVTDAAGLAAQEQDSCLRLEDVLDTSSPSLFEDAPSKTVHNGHESGPDTGGAGANAWLGLGTVVATNSVSPVSSIASVLPQAGPVSPDEAYAAMLLSLQRMDM